MQTLAEDQKQAFNTSGRDKTRLRLRAATASCELLHTEAQQHLNGKWPPLLLLLLLLFQTGLNSLSRLAGQSVPGPISIL